MGDPVLEYTKYSRLNMSGYFDLVSSCFIIFHVFSASQSKISKAFPARLASFAGPAIPFWPPGCIKA